VVSHIVAINNEVCNQFVLEIKAGMIAADVNAHAQFKHVRGRGCENPATLSHGGVFTQGGTTCSN
jgi:hypothetical protein